MTRGRKEAEVVDRKQSHLQRNLERTTERASAMCCEIETVTGD